MLTSRYPQVPVPSPNPPLLDPSFPSCRGLRRTGDKSSPRGRGLVATASFPAGSAIAVCPRPLLCFPDGEQVRTACDWCLRPGTTEPPVGSGGSGEGAAAAGGGAAGAGGRVKLSVCTGCRYVVYCSRKCQASAWRAVHKLECSVIRRVREGVFGTAAAGGKDKGPGVRWFVPTPVRAAMQLLLRLRKGDDVVRDAVGDLPFVNTGAVTRREGVLEGNVQRFREDGDGTVWKDLGAQAGAALKFAGIELEGDRLAAAAEGVRALLCMLQTNAFDRRDEDVGAAGVLLDVDLAMANHSCVPNAYVCFEGRTTALRAERDIEVGEEVEISYIDNTMSKAQRHRALRLYHFQCECRRCREDLDIYQVCQSSPTIPLNIFSLQPDLKLYSNPDIDRDGYTSPPPSGGSTSHSLWEQVQPLLDRRMYAIEPLPSIVHDLVIRYETKEQNFAYALSLACFLATRCHPYAHVAPFKPWRVKGLMMIAQLLSQTAPLSAMGELGKTCPARTLVDKLARMDQVSMCEAVLRLVVHYGPMAHSDDWDVVRSARELLDDIAQLQGRERESAAIGAWASDPQRPDARAFIDQVVLVPIETLAAHAVEIISKALRGDDRLALTAPPVSSLRRLVYQPNT